MFTRFKLGFVALVAAAALGGAPAGAAAASRLPVFFYPNIEHPSRDLWVRFPKLINLSDNPTWFLAGSTRTGNNFSKLDWKWTGQTAVATGAFWVFTNLETGAVRPYTMRLTLSDPQTFGRHLAFAQVSIRLLTRRVPKPYTRVMNTHIAREEGIYQYLPGR